MQDDIKKILKEAQDSVREKKLEKAHQLLSKIFEVHSDNSEVCCWAWFLSYHHAMNAENAEKKIDCLIKGLSTCAQARIDCPNDDRFNKILQTFKTALEQETDNAIKNGDNEKARPLLKHIVDCDPNNEKAWIVLENIAESDEERLDYLKKIVNLNPNSHSAQNRLTELLEKQNFFKNQEINADDEIDSTDETASTIEEQSDNKNNSDEISLQIQKNIDGREQVESEKENRSDKIATLSVKKKQIIWNQPFKTGQDVVNHFGRHLEEIIQVLQALASNFQKDVKTLNSIKEHHKSWDDRKSRNIFLSPAVRVGTSISHNLLESDKFAEAFWVANIFSEMSKALVSKKPEKKQEYQNYYKSLLVTACCAVGRSYWNDQKNIFEIKQLYNQINKVCLKNALKTFFHPSSDQFKPVREENKSLKDEILNNSSAWLFDKHLQDLLQNNRSEVNKFIEKNLPHLYQLKFFGRWQNAQRKWKALLENEGFDQVLRDLEKSNALVNRDEVGKINAEQFSQILEASKNHDYQAISALLKGNVEQLVSFLHHEMSENFDYRKPWLPYKSLDRSDKLNRNFLNKVPNLASSNNQKKLQEAEEITRNILGRDLDKEYEFKREISAYYDWLGYIQLKIGKYDLAEKQLQIVQNRREKRWNFTTHWNLAVLAYSRQNAQQAYELLLPFLENNREYDSIAMILLTLAYEAKHFSNLSTIVSQTANWQFSPLAFVMAYEKGEEEEQRKFLAKITESHHLQLPPIDVQLGSIELSKIVDRARIDSPTQVIEWLEARKKSKPTYIPNYVELAKVYEQTGKIEKAYSALRERFEKNQRPEFTDHACRDLLEFCKRNHRSDLGQKAYDLIGSSGNCANVLKSFETFFINKPEPIPPKEENFGIGSKVKKFFGGLRLGGVKQTVGLFVDHENLLHSLENISRKRGIHVPRKDDAKVHWLSEILGNLSEEFIQRTGDVTHYKIAVAFWNRPSEAALSSAYEENGFILHQPEEIKQSNAVDFKLADEVRRLQHQAVQERSSLKEVVIVSGDTDYAHMVRSLLNDGVNVQIWGGNEAINQASYGEIVGKDNIVIIDDICGL